MLFTEHTNVIRVHCVHRGQAKFVELAQGALIHEARVVKIGCRLMDRPEGVTSIRLTHDISNRNLWCRRCLSRRLGRLDSSFLGCIGDDFKLGGSIRLLKQMLNFLHDRILDRELRAIGAFQHG